MKVILLPLLLALSVYQAVFVDAVIYTRWGRTSCPVNAAILYTGYVGGSLYNHQGNGANILCLPEVPEYGNVQPGDQQPGWIVGAIYAMGGYANNLPFSYANNAGVDISGSSPPCVVCFRSDRVDVAMIPAKKSCPVDGMTLEYTGYLASTPWNEYRSEYICFDGTPEVVTGKPGHDHVGINIRPVQAGGWALNSPPYQDFYELTCAVCTI